MNECKVDIPITVPEDMAEEIVQELKETDRVEITVTRGNAPDIVEQIEWQLENEQPLLEIVEEYND